MEVRALSLCFAAILLAACASTDPAPAQEPQVLMRDDAGLAADARREAQRYVAVVYFEEGSAVVDDSGRRQLAWFVEQMRPYPRLVIDVRGYADVTDAESAEANLAQLRASNVTQVLEERGLPIARLRPQGHTADLPDARGDDPSERRRNRRVVVRVH